VRYFDAHVHLQDSCLRNHWPVLSKTLPSHGLVEAVCNGTSRNDWPAVAALARQCEWIRPAFGLHPWHVGSAREGWLDKLRAYLVADGAAVVGEIGLDRWILDSARADDARLTGLERASLEAQEAAFIAQLELSTELKRPPTIHCLHAWNRIEQILSHSHRPSTGFLLHAFSGPPDRVKVFLELGAYFSFNGYFLAPRHAAVRDVFASIPLERLLVETDAPAMPFPESHRKHALPAQPNEPAPIHPANIEVAYAALAELRGMSVASLSGVIERNFRRLFDHLGRGLNG